MTNTASQDRKLLNLFGDSSVNVYFVELEWVFLTFLHFFTICC